MEQQNIIKATVIWRGKQLNVEIDQNCNVKDFGQMLQELTNIKPETMKLLIPQSTNKSSKLIDPFSDTQSSQTLQDISITEGKSIRMMGVSEDEIEEVSENNKRPDLRIIGFDEEEKRMKQRASSRPQISLKLPTGPYIFCDFRTLHIPGIELNPPPSEALKRMHMLACDPGIIAIMNKHKWRVGIMTEMAPVGYVGISPKCLLGFNKNNGEEVSLRLRTDDLKGLRKYESIKKTLLHELAHMVYSEHDANFFALNKQLNEEASSLDWTKSRGHTLSIRKNLNTYEEAEEYFFESSKNIISNKLGGEMNPSSSPRSSSAAAAYKRFLNRTVIIDSEGYDKSELEPDPDDSKIEIDITESKLIISQEPDPDDSLTKDVIMDGLDRIEKNHIEPVPDDGKIEIIPVKMKSEPDPDDIGESNHIKSQEPDPDDSLTKDVIMVEPKQIEKNYVVPDPDDSVTTDKNHKEPDPDDGIESMESEEIKKIEEPVTVFCSRLQKAIQMLRYEVRPAEVASVIQTLSKIIRNVIEHPNETKFKRLRKANPNFQRNVVSYTAAMEVLKMVGFSEDVIADEIGRAEIYLVLKRNDPGLLWLAKSSLEVSIA